ncbi:MAG: class II fumarate hydratase [Pseudomonadota bacterium]|nr:class II fumarate hydratase [Pseudomonadota bacterium]
MASTHRTEHDSLGDIQVPGNALWGAQTQRAIDNFPLSGWPLPAPFISALGWIKFAAAGANAELGTLALKKAEAIQSAAQAVASGAHNDQFPVDVFQTGSGTSSNMNANEVIARLCEQAGVQVHPNDDVNLGQSSNDVIPTAIRVSAVLQCRETLLPALHRLCATLEARASELDGVVKTGRTHLMDAMPLTLGQELRTWEHQLLENRARIDSCLERLRALPQGGTAVGTGVNTHPRFADAFCALLSRATETEFVPLVPPFAGIASQEGPLELSATLRSVATSLLKISNDLRWMNSGPLTGLAEISLPVLQPGSSIMPGKVNPVIPEAVAQVAVQVTAYDAAVALAAQSGNFQLNVMLPLIAHNLLTSIRLLAGAAQLLADKAVAGFRVNQSHIESGLLRNPILATALNPKIGYARAAEIAKEAYRSGRPVIEVAAEMTDLSDDELAALLDPHQLAEPHSG